VEQPEEFVAEGTTKLSHILELLKALYGLVQAGYVWYNTIADYLLELGFVRSELDHALFYRDTESARVYFGLHVDDSMSTGNDTSEILALEKTLDAKFEATHYLGTTLHRDPAAGTISLGQ
ncbi:reverse transcriptase, partial [Exidia glandulosa HHB12029]